MTKAVNEFMKALHGSAIEYAERGLSVIPLGVDDKKPLNAWKEFQTRVPDGDEIDDWFENGAPTKSGERVKVFNLAIVTGALSGLVVLDCDNADAIEFAKENRLQSPFTVSTMRGRHYYFQHPRGGAKFKNATGGSARMWPDIRGLDFRGDGGYAVAPRP